MKTDAVNAFPATSAVAMINAAHKIGTIFYHTLVRYGGVGNIEFTDPKTGYTAHINRFEGVFQGDIFGSSLFNVALAPVISKTAEENPQAIIIGQHDDQYLIAPLEHLFPTLGSYEKNLKDELNVDSNRTKTAAFTMGDAEAQQKLKLACEQHGVTYAPDGIIVNGAPIGSSKFEMDFVNAAVDKTLETMDNVAFMVKLTDKSKSGPSRQQVYQLVRLCVPTQLVHIMRTTPTSSTDAAMLRFDKGLFERMQSIFPNLSESAGFDRDATLDNAPACRLFLPWKKGGGGILSCATVYVHAYAGSLIKVGQRLMDRLKVTAAAGARAPGAGALPAQTRASRAVAAAAAVRTAMALRSRRTC